jgi:hypothetical protein
MPPGVPCVPSLTVAVTSRGLSASIVTGASLSGESLGSFGLKCESRDQGECLSETDSKPSRQRKRSPCCCVPSALVLWFGGA